MNTGGGREPSEHFSSLLNKSVIRNERWEEGGNHKSEHIKRKENQSNPYQN